MDASLKTPEGGWAAYNNYRSDKLELARRLAPSVLRFDTKANIARRIKYLRASVASYESAHPADVAFEDD